MRTASLLSFATLLASIFQSTDAFRPHTPRRTHSEVCQQTRATTQLFQTPKHWAQAAATGLLSAALLFGPQTALAENELSDKYGGGLDTSLVDQTCLVNQCSLQAKACLQDDPNCRKGLTCTAKCLGDNACITGCMARYGDSNLDNLLKCTIEDHECIKVAILPGGADAYGQEPSAPGPTLVNFDHKSLQGSWFKVMGYNPNYDCYACQRNTFEVSDRQRNSLQMDVEFSMPHLLPDGSPLPPSGVQETFVGGLQSMALNDYHTHETMVFDKASSGSKNALKLKTGTDDEVHYARTAHSEGEMFGLKFWENWYILGENDKDADEEFKFVYYNGKTRQNTYEGAFIYSRTKDLSETSMKKIYQIAKDADMDPSQFCRIKNGCFADPLEKDTSMWRGFLASTKVSELLGVEPVAAQDTIRRNVPTASVLTPDAPSTRKWWHEVGDYLENPHRHFQAMDDLRETVVWPDDVIQSYGKR